MKRSMRGGASGLPWAHIVLAVAPGVTLGKEDNFPLKYSVQASVFKVWSLFTPIRKLHQFQYNLLDNFFLP